MQQKSCTGILARMNLSDINRLAELSRLDIPTEEKEMVLTDLTAIIGYVDQIQSISIDRSNEVINPIPRNVVRDDVSANESGSYTDTLLDQMPDHEGSYLKVPRIL